MSFHLRIRALPPPPLPRLSRESTPSSELVPEPTPIALSSERRSDVLGEHNWLWKSKYKLLLIIRWWYLFCEEPFFVSPFGDDAVVVNHSLVKSGFLAYQYLGLDQELRHQLRHAGHYWLEQCFSNVSPNVAVDFGRFIS